MSGTEAFPKEFLWGAATSAYQVEGSPLADGAGPGMWHRFTHTAGRTYRGQTGDTACDHYRRYRDDVALMAKLGLGAYRFSIAWGRILPEGRGRVNPAGLDFYSRLVDALLEHGIRPCATLYHWDLPAALDDRGGWLNPDVAGWFAEYADTVARALGDRVALWMTLNEPWVSVDAGYVHAVHAPGHRSLFEAARAAHNLLRAHGAGVRALRAATGAPVGVVVNVEPKDAASDREEDVRAAREADAYMNRQFLEPALTGRYPEELAAIYGEAWFEPSREDMALIRTPVDFIGLNYYTRAVTAFDPAGWPVRARPVPQESSTYTAVGWEVRPAGLTELLLRLHGEYGLPVYVTENGAAFYDPPVSPPEGISDPLRVAYLRDHLRAVRDARALGADVRGYFAWSLFDNFEWSIGFSVRFGLVHVDFASQARTPKASARFYSEVIRTGAGSLGQ